MLSSLCCKVVLLLAYAIADANVLDLSLEDRTSIFLQVGFERSVQVYRNLSRVEESNSANDSTLVESKVDTASTRVQAVRQIASPLRTRADKQVSLYSRLLAHADYVAEVTTFEHVLWKFLSPRDSLATDWKLWSGMILCLTVWAWWLRWGYCGSYSFKATFCLGLNLQFLALCQYGMQIYCVLILCLQAAFQVRVWWRPHDILSSKKPQFICSSMYQDVSGPLLQSIFLFIGQSLLISFLLSAVVSSFDPHRVVYTYWISAYFAVQMSAFFNRGADSALGKVWPVAEWMDLATCANDLEFTCVGRRGSVVSPFKVTRAEFALRGIMGFAVNNVMRDIVAFLSPIMLMEQGDPMEFVVYALSASYICRLDAMTDKEYLVGTESIPIEGRLGTSYDDFNQARSQSCYAFT